MSILNFSNVKLVSNNDIYFKTLSIHTKSPGMRSMYSGTNMLFINKQNCVIKYIPRYDEQNNGYFEDNSVNTVNIGLPFNDVDSIVVYPEEGDWYLDKIIIKDLFFDLSETFECDELLGTDSTPAKILEKSVENKFNELTYDQNMKEYEIYKHSINKTLLMLFTFGSLGTYYVQNDTSFFYGGIIGMVYWKMLQTETNIIASKNELNLLLFPLVCSGSRFIFISLSFIQFMNLEEKSLLPFFVGFFTYKIALIIQTLQTKK
jgi:hypothetical protein